MPVMFATQKPRAEGVDMAMHHDWQKALRLIGPHHSRVFFSLTLIWYYLSIPYLAALRPLSGSLSGISLEILIWYYLQNDMYYMLKKLCR